MTLVIKPRVTCMLGKSSTVELQLSYQVNINMIIKVDSWVIPNLSDSTISLDRLEHGQDPEIPGSVCQHIWWIKLDSLWPLFQHPCQTWDSSSPKTFFFPKFWPPCQWFEEKTTFLWFPMDMRSDSPWEVSVQLYYVRRVPAPTIFTGPEFSLLFSLHCYGSHSSSFNWIMDLMKPLNGHKFFLHGLPL